VRKGEPLLYVASPDYSQLRAAYLKAKDAYELADKNFARAKDLYDHHAIATRDLEAAESARNQAQADLQSSQQNLRILGFRNPDEPAKNSAELPLLAPIGGEVVERLIAPGQVIQAGATQAFTISNMSTVWVLVNVYQQDLPYVRVGDPVTITADAYPGSQLTGKISYVGAALDPTTRSLQARIDVKNPQEKLKKDMYVVAAVQAGKIPNALTVPNASVLRDSENEPFVYVLEGSNQFRRQGVRTGTTANGVVQVTSGLNPGDRVAGDGSVFLQFANSLQK
jgi:membrane fusion protein, heavy metal efflux system